MLSDKYVTDDSGTGIVHEASAFGEDDCRVCLAQKIIVKGGDIPCPVGSNEIYTEKCKDFLGQYVKDADPKICEKLKVEGRFVQKDVISHYYPFCWRSDTPLIYKAVPSWCSSRSRRRTPVPRSSVATRSSTAGSSPGPCLTPRSTTPSRTQTNGKKWKKEIFEVRMGLLYANLKTNLY